MKLLEGSDMMSARWRNGVGIVAVLLLAPFAGAQGPDLPPLPPLQPFSPPINQQPAAQPQPGPAPANLPNGIEVLARGPIHEAFASPTVDPKPTQLVPKKPPQALDELPPDEKPEGDVVWIGGYWAWDDDRADFLWVSGCWRAKPAGKEWVPGYWREQAGQSQWVSGFWANVAADGRASEVVYYPEPPAPPQLAPPGDPPNNDMMYVPGYWMWTSNRYTWRAGYWTRGRPGHVYVASHYRWTPHGHVFVAGYWDYAVADRGVLYAPVVVDPIVMGPRFTYVPYYAVREPVVVECFFVRPGFAHYYFGDWYGPRYSAIGFECCYTYSRRRYDPIVSYRAWEFRDHPRWVDVQINLTVARHAGRAPVPPRTLVQQNNVVVNNVTNVTNVTNINNTNVKNINVTKNVTNVNDVLAPTRNVVNARGAKTVSLDAATKDQVKTEAVAARHSMMSERKRNETAGPAGTAPLATPRSAEMRLPPTAAARGPATTTPIGKGPDSGFGGPRSNPAPLEGKQPIGTLPKRFEPVGGLKEPQANPNLPKNPPPKTGQPPLTNPMNPPPAGNPNTTPKQNPPFDPRLRPKQKTPPKDGEAPRSFGGDNPPRGIGAAGGGAPGDGPAFRQLGEPRKGLGGKN